MASSTILGDWTHRRGDRGGSRAVAASVEAAKPAVSWTWQPDHGGRVDQVRLVGGSVVVATMMPRDPAAPNWEHAVVYLLDARTGSQVARRALPDPVPVAAMAVEGEQVHVVATRRGEPIFRYELSLCDLVPRRRAVVSTGDPTCSEDVLDVWATREGGLWFELDASSLAGVDRFHAYAFVESGSSSAEVHFKERRHASGPPLARDACAGDLDLFVPVEGLWSGEADAFPPTISRLGAHDPDAADAQADSGTWARSSILGPQAQMHALEAQGLIFAAAVAEEPGRPDRGRVEVLTIERSTGSVRWRAQRDRVHVRSRLGDAARIARRPNGELLVQGLGVEGEPCTPLLCARPDGQLDELLLGARGRHVLDAALGDLVLAHREDRDGTVEVSGFGIHNEGRLLGRRAVSRWAVDVGNLGGETTVYAGAGAIVVRGARGLCALKP